MSELIVVDKKTCSGCKAEKSLEEFSRGTGTHKRNNYCKICHRAKAKEDYKKNRNIRLNQVADWNKENPEKVAEYQQTFKERKRKVDY
jgi:hypothetical protein